VGVGVEGHGYGRVAEELLHDLGVDALDLLSFTYLLAKSWTRCIYARQGKSGPGSW
jgi:hypothetical protein